MSDPMYICASRSECLDTECRHRAEHRRNESCERYSCDGHNGVGCIAVAATPALYRCNKLPECDQSRSMITCRHNVSHIHNSGCDIDGCGQNFNARCTVIGSSFDNPIINLAEAIRISGNGSTIYVSQGNGVVTIDPTDAMLDALEDSGIEPDDIDYDSFDEDWDHEYNSDHNLFEDLRPEGGDVMPQGTTHERMRFQQMSERQLWTRLGKITTHEKFINFAAMARDFGYEALAIAAEAKLKVATGETNLSLDKRPNKVLKKVNGERLTRKLNI